MTGPGMSPTEQDPPPQPVPVQIGWGLQDMTGPLHRLGLTWRLRPATVSGSGTQTRLNAILGVFDGDTTRSRFFSMIGPVYGGARVWALVVPPGGNYIVGWYGPPAMRWDTFTGTTDGTGRVSAPHGCPYTPSVVMVQMNLPVSGSDIVQGGNVDQITATTFRVRCWDLVSSLALTSTEVSGFYLALP